MIRKLFFIFALMLLPTAALNAGDNTALGTVDQYTQALSSGDVVALKNILGGRLYTKRRVLLEENTEYPDWLREYYSGASFSASLSAASSARYPTAVLVEVETTLANGEVASTRLVLQPDAAGSEWKIIDQIR